MASSWNGAALQPSRPAPPVPGSTGAACHNAPASTAPTGSLRPLLTTASSSSSARSAQSDGLSRSMHGLNLNPGSFNSADYAQTRTSQPQPQYSTSQARGGPSTPAPNRHGFIRDGPVQTKEDGIRSMFFVKRYAILRDTALTFHKSKEVGLFVRSYISQYPTYPFIRIRLNPQYELSIRTFNTAHSHYTGCWNRLCDNISAGHRRDFAYRPETILHRNIL